MYGRSLQCLNSKIYARNAQSQPFNFQISGKSPYFQNSFFCLIEYISVSINATDAYYTSNDWKLSQLFAEPSRFELRGLHEELEALKQFSFFPPRPYIPQGFQKKVTGESAKKSGRPMYYTGRRCTLVFTALLHIFIAR